jgi:peptide/histidine transporter 3/4
MFSRFFDKAAIVSAPSDNESTVPLCSWRLCTVTQVEELKMLLLTMVYAALLETRRLAVAEASGLRNQDAPVPMSILWQAPLYVVHGAAQVFAGVGATKFFYDQSPETMKSLCAALGQLALASASYMNSLLLSIVAVATTRGGAPGWIPDNLNEGHLDYFFWMMATLSLLNVALFVRYSMRHTVKMAR